MVKPLLKWAGGKRQIVPDLLEHIPTSFDRYFEPFFGGGAFYFALFEQGLLKESIISDINYDLYNFYKVVKERPEDLILSLKSLSFTNTPESYYLARERFNSLNPNNDLVEKAALLIYLNRHCFNGLYRVNAKGKFNVPFGRYTNPYLPNRDHILSISESLQDTNIMHQDFQNVEDQADSGDFVYFDPPYDPISATSNFTWYSDKEFGNDEQADLASLAKTLDRKQVYVMVSNSDTPLIRKLYSRFHISVISASRPINSKSSGRGKINELIITNY